MPPSAAGVLAAKRRRKVARTLAGYFGPVDLSYRLYRSDKYASQIEEITDWAAGTISLGNDRDAGWALSLEMMRTDQIDPWRDYVLAMAELAVGGDPDDLERFPLGLYRTARDEMLPAITYLEELELWSLQMESQEAELAEWPPEEVYSVPSGTGVLAAVRRILNMLGWPDTLITFPPPTADSPLTSTMVLDPFEDSASSNWLGFCNTLLGSRSFYALKTDRWGRWFTEKIRDAADFPPDIHYGPDPLEPLIVGDIQEGRDTTRFANVVIAASQDTSQSGDGATRISVTAVNEDPDSPASVTNYGRRVYKRLERQTIGSREDGIAIARAELARSASFHRSPRITTLADPRRFQIRQTYGITDHSGDREILSEVPRWDVTSVSLPINHAGEQETMAHELGAVYPLEARIV
ncbi:MAG: hypothetical protein M3R38_03005 [Actinomycetota bacterium]|nr:hypothetical protein [Actinomycetota bacterium]